MHLGLIPPLLPTNRKRPARENDETAEERAQKRQRRLDQKQAMRKLRQAKNDCQTDTLDDMTKAHEALEQLLLITATPSEIEPIDIEPLPGRRGKEKVILEEMRLMAAKLCILAQRALELKTNE